MSPCSIPATITITPQAPSSVYYRRQSCKGWYGPAKIFDKEGQSLLIRHSGAFDRKHPCHLMKANKKLGSPRNERNEMEEEDEGQHNKSLHIIIAIPTTIPRISGLKKMLSHLCRQTTKHHTYVMSELLL